MDAMPHEAKERSVFMTPASSLPPPADPDKIAPDNTPTTNSLAITSLVCSLLGCCSLLGIGISCIFMGLGILGSLMGIIYGIIAKKQIRNSYGQEKGTGLANAGIIIGILLPFLEVALVIVAAISLMQGFRHMR